MCSTFAPSAAPKSDYSNRLPCKGSWTRVHERTEGLKGIALFIQIPYTPKKSLRLALRQPTSLFKGGESLRLALTRLTFIFEGCGERTKE